MDHYSAPVPAGFAAAHEEWLKQGGMKLREKFLNGIQPAFYRTNYWKLVREAVLQRDNHCCIRCGQKAEQVHHLHYSHRGRDHYYPETMVSICRECHGLAEYVRLAESLQKKFKYRLSCAEKFAAGEAQYAEETPVKILSRLLEYREEFDGLRTRFHNKTPYTNHKLTAAEAAEFDQKYNEKMTRFQKEAQKTVASWDGADMDKSKRVAGMILEESKKCADFIAGFSQPTPKVS